MGEMKKYKSTLAKKKTVEKGEHVDVIINVKRRET